jgi:UDP-2,3-diacylglucosamine hydrolase
MNHAGHMQETVGLLAGYGQFPVVFAQAARRLGFPVVCVGITEEAGPELKDLVDHFYWSRPAQLGKMINRFKKHGVKNVVMAGKIHKANLLHKPWKIFNLAPDLRTLIFWYLRKRADNKDDTLLLSIIKEFAKDGINFASALDYIPEILVQPGTLTRRSASNSEMQDIYFGWKLAREMGRMDVGQSVAVKDRAVLAVEAIEGTDKNITRAGEYCKSGGFVVVKVAKPNQDRRFDVPTIGIDTIQTLHKARGKVLAIEAGQTIFLGEKEAIILANELGITIIALTDKDIPA